jgi:hypothetical protein
MKKDKENYFIKNLPDATGEEVPFVCTRNITPGDNVALYFKDKRSLWKTSFSSITEEDDFAIWLFTNGESIYSYSPNDPDINSIEACPFKIIGRVSDKANWIKEGDVFTPQEFAAYASLESIKGKRGIEYHPGIVFFRDPREKRMGSFTKETIRDGNKVIAEFMGYKYYGHNHPDLLAYKKRFESGWWEVPLEKIASLPSVKMYRNKYICRNHNELPFFSDYEWLIKVVERVEAIYDDFHGYFGVHISSNSCTIQGTKLRTNPENPHYAYFNSNTLLDKRESTWYTVLQFIKWYNTKDEKTR